MYASDDVCALIAVTGTHLSYVWNIFLRISIERIIFGGNGYNFVTAANVLAEETLKWKFTHSKVPHFEEL